MRLACLFSGGKDSAFAAHSAILAGHEVACLITASPGSPDDPLLHHPNTRWAALQAEAAGIPHVAGAGGGPEALESLLGSAAEEFGIGGLVHGGIRSGYQRRVFSELCSRLGLVPVSPLWGSDAMAHMRGLVEGGFRFVVTSVSAGGLDGSWLGREVSAADVERLGRLGARHGFSPDFEGGEAETFVTGCPLFARRVEITGARSEWDGYRGIFEITGARLGG